MNAPLQATAEPVIQHERWLGVPGHDGYEVSNFGRVRSWRRPGGGRRSAPRLNGGAKLSNAQAIAIRASGKPGWQLATEYGVAQSTISRIRHRVRYASATQDTQ